MAGPAQRIAVVTGSNKGIGLAVVARLCQEKDLKVYLTARDEAKGKEALEKLAKSGVQPHFHQLDINDHASVKRLREDLQKDGIDILINNAAIAFSGDAPEPFGEQAVKTLQTNYYDTINCCHELFPILNKGARVVNLSSSVGTLSCINGTEPEASQFKEKLSKPDLTVPELTAMADEFVKRAKDENLGGWQRSSYSVSKVLVSALTRIQQREMEAARPNEDILINAVHPGYVNTDMTRGRGPLTVERGAESTVFAALLPPNTATNLKGGFYWDDCSVYDWLANK